MSAEESDIKIGEARVKIEKIDDILHQVDTGAARADIGALNQQKTELYREIKELEESKGK